MKFIYAEKILALLLTVSHAAIGARAVETATAVSQANIAAAGAGSVSRAPAISGPSLPAPTRPPAPIRSPAVDANVRASELARQTPSQQYATKSLVVAHMRVCWLGAAR